MQSDYNRIIEKVYDRLKLLPPYIEEFIDYRVSASPHTLDNYTRDYLGFFNWLIKRSSYKGDPNDVTKVSLHTLEKLRTQDVAAYERYCLVKLKNKTDTVARKLASLKALFHYLSQIAEDEELYPYLHRNVFARIDVKKERVSDRRRAEVISQKILVREEFSEFRDFIYNKYTQVLLDNNQKRMHSAHLRNRERDLALVSLILGSGLRISEALSINIDEIDWNKNSALITRKGDSYDVATFSDIAAEDMKLYLNIRNQKFKPDSKTKAFFLAGKTNTGTSKRFSVRSAQKMFKKYAEAYGKSLSLHKLRHSFATKHYQENKDIALLKKILDHQNIETTMIYTHIFEEQIKDSINRADK